MGITQYSQRITIGAHHHTLQLAHADTIPDVRLSRAWQRIARQDELYVQQIGFKPTWLGIVFLPAQRELFRCFLRMVLCNGVGWDDLVRQHIMIDLRDGAAVAVYCGHALKRNGRVARALQDVVRAAEKAVVADRQDQCAQVQTLMDGVCAIPFFYEHFMERHARLIPLLREGKTHITRCVIKTAVNALSGSMIVVAGMIDMRDAEQLIEKLRENATGKNDLPGLLCAAGHVMIVIDETGHHVYVQSDDQALCATIIRRVSAYIEGFLSVLVISDTQMGANSACDFFGHAKEEELISLLRWVIAHDAMVIINGDFLGIDLKKENAVGSIVATYHELFAVLKHVRRIVYVTGNHDMSVLDERVGLEVLRCLPKVEILRNYQMQRQEMLLYFEHGHIQTGVYKKWYTHILFGAIDVAHEICEWLKRMIAGDQMRYPANHLLYYLTKVLVSIPFVRMVPIRFFTIREVSRALAVSQALNEGLSEKRLTVICCGHIHNRIEAGYGWTNAFLNQILPNTAYVNTGAWNASILQDLLFKEDMHPEARNRSFFDHDAPLVKRDWLCVTSRGQLVMGSGEREFIAKMCQSANRVDISAES